MPCWGFPARRSRLTIFPLNLCLQVFYFPFGKFYQMLLPSSCAAHMVSWEGAGGGVHIQEVHAAPRESEGALTEELSSPGLWFRSTQRGWGGRALCRDTSFHPFFGDKEPQPQFASLPLSQMSMQWCRCTPVRTATVQILQNQRRSSTVAMFKRLVHQEISSRDLKKLTEIFFQTPSLDLLQEQTQRAHTNPSVSCFPPLITSPLEMLPGWKNRKRL